MFLTPDPLFLVNSSHYAVEYPSHPETHAVKLFDSLDHSPGVSPPIYDFHDNGFPRATEDRVSGPLSFQKRLYLKLLLESCFPQIFPLLYLCLCELNFGTRRVQLPYSYDPPPNYPFGLQEGLLSVLMLK